MWEEQDEDEEDGLAGQLLSDILATSKYGERSEESSGGKCLCCARYRELGAKKVLVLVGPRIPSAAPGDTSFPGPLPEPPVRLSLTEDDYYEDDEEDDPDALKDPLYQVDLQAYLTDFLCQFAQQPCYVMFSGHLNDNERRVLQTIGI